MSFSDSAEMTPRRRKMLVRYAKEMLEVERTKWLKLMIAVQTGDSTILDDNPEDSLIDG